MALRDFARLERIREGLKAHTPKDAPEPCDCDHCWLLRELDSTDDCADKIQDKLHELQALVGQ